ncbi:hypothetical protein Dimus_027534 [Dionaea muscipula]
MSTPQVRTQEFSQTYSHLEEELVIGLEDDVLELSNMLFNDHHHKLYGWTRRGKCTIITLSRNTYRGSLGLIYHYSVRKQLLYQNCRDTKLFGNILCRSCTVIAWSMLSFRRD